MLSFLGSACTNWPDWLNIIYSLCPTSLSQKEPNTWHNLPYSHFFHINDLHCAVSVFCRIRPCLLVAQKPPDQPHLPSPEEPSFSRPNASSPFTQCPHLTMKWLLRVLPSKEFIVSWQLQGVVTLLKYTLGGEKGVTFGQTLSFPPTRCEKSTMTWKSPLTVCRSLTETFSYHLPFKAFPHLLLLLNSQTACEAGGGSSLSSTMLSHRKVKWLS